MASGHFLNLCCSHQLKNDDVDVSPCFMLDDNVSDSQWECVAVGVFLLYNKTKGEDKLRTEKR